MEELGYLSLFTASFLSATVLPFSSEAIVAAMVLGRFNPWYILVIATIGNWLGSVLTYYMGYVGDWNRIQRWLRIDEKKTEKYVVYSRRYGAWVGLLVWLPGIGDVLAICMGLIRCNQLLSATTILMGKFARYAIIIYLTCLAK